MTRPTVEWQLVENVVDYPSHMNWDGDEAKLNRDYLNNAVPKTHSFSGGYRAVVGDLEIGCISVVWQSHRINWPNRLCINGYSFLDTKKRGGGYGRNFDDEVLINDRTMFKRNASIDEAKDYVEGLFQDMVEKAKLCAIGG